MLPFAIASSFAFGGWRGIIRVSFKPLLYNVMVELFRPKHAGETLAHHVLRVRGKSFGNDGRIKFVRLCEAPRKDRIEILKGLLRGKISIREPQTDHRRRARPNCEVVMRRNLGSALLRIYGICDAMHDIVIDAV